MYRNLILAGAIAMLISGQQYSANAQSLMNGTHCRIAPPPAKSDKASHDKCRSRLCLPGPSDFPRSEKVPVNWYCTSKGANCAFPGTSGFKDGQVARLNGKLYVCHRRPSKGWGRFVPKT